MSWASVAVRRPKWIAKELAYRTGLRSYRPDSAADWDSFYRRKSSEDALEVKQLRTLAKYGITVGYLSMFAPRAEILDVGCGPGSLRHYLQPGAFRRYVGVDNSPHAIDVAQTSFDDPETSFVLADDIPSDLQPFSAVVMLDVLYHVEEPMRTIQRVKEVTQPDGIVIASHWRHPGEWMLLDMLDREFERLDVVTFENHRDQILSPLGHRISCHRRVG